MNTPVWKVGDRVTLRDGDGSVAVVNSSGRRLGLRAPHLSCSPKVKEWLVDKGMSPDWGAREVIRLISKEITVQVAELLLAGNDGAPLHVHVDGDRLVMAVKE